MYKSKKPTLLYRDLGSMSRAVVKYFKYVDEVKADS